MTGNELKQLREHHKLTAVQVATELDYRGSIQAKKTQIYRWESGLRPIPRQVAKLIIQLYAREK